MHLYDGILNYTLRFTDYAYDVSKAVFSYIVCMMPCMAFQIYSSDRSATYLLEMNSCAYKCVWFDRCQ